MHFEPGYMAYGSPHGLLTSIYVLLTSYAGCGGGGGGSADFDFICICLWLAGNRLTPEEQSIHPLG